MKQIVSNYSYSPTANCVTLTGLNIDQDQLLLVVAPGVGRTLYNFASVTGSVVAGTNTRINLTASTAGLTTTSPLVIYYDDQSAAQSVTGTVALDLASLISLENITVTVGSSVSISNFPSIQTIAGAVTANVSQGNTQFNPLFSYIVDPTNDQIFATDYPLPIFGTVTANVEWQAGEFYPYRFDGDSAPDMGTAVVFQKNDYGAAIVGDNNPLPISGTVTVANSNFDNDGNLLVTLQPGPTPYTQPISGTVTVGNSVAIGSLPVQLSTTTIGGTSRLNVTLSSATTVGNTAPSYANLYGGSDGTSLRAILTDTSGRTVVTVSNFPSTQPVSLASLPSLAAGTAQIGSVTASISGTVPVSGTFYQATQPVSLASLPSLAAGTAQIGSVTATISGTPTVTMGAISGTVTANNPSGALTTRFGSVTTANTAQLTAAVTNTSRKYLLCQNISSGTVTIGIGFSPTTTQGVQLTAGAGISFDSFCPTGAVWWLGATTGANFTILEG